VLVFRDNRGSLSILVHPELRTVVEDEDLSYIESLLRDFPERARLHPADLFRQLSSLGVGPLVANEVGLDLSECPSLKELSLRFVQL
jgi:hypothetical protein